LKVSKCGAGEGWRRSVGSIVWEMERGRKGEYTTYNIKKEG